MRLIKVILILFLPMIMFSQEVTVSLQESAGGCGLSTDCDNGVLCVDIVMSVDQTKNLDSYNVWVTYNKDVLSRKSLAANDDSGAGDNSCVIANGAQDTDAESSNGAWRVAGVPGSPYAMTANTDYVVHTMCFTILDNTFSGLNGQNICVGGDQFGGSIKSTVTFDDASFDDALPASCLTLSKDFTSCSTLPVRYVSFGVDAKGMDAALSWETASEVNNSHFEIERSVDGRRWDYVGRVAGKGTTGGKQSYTYTDAGIGRKLSTVYYRLVQVDYDGSESESEVRVVNFKDVEGEVSIYPNPVRDELNVTYTGGSTYRVLIYDMMGKLVSDSTGDSKIDMSVYKGGTYTVRVIDGSGSMLKTESVVVIR